MTDPRISSGPEYLRPEHGIVGDSQVMMAVLARVEAVAKSGLSVLIEGDTGTGKELAALRLHALSGRAGECVVVNCTAISDNLLLSELFGHVSGAYTSATSPRRGLVERAKDGTLFIDEVGDLSPRGQAALLRLVDEGTYRSVGSDEVKAAKVRVVAATNRNSRRMVKEGKFRDDLYARLRRVKIRIPPLRDRRQDIPLIAQDFLATSKELAAIGRKTISPQAMALLCAHDWPLNVRELQDVLIDATLEATGKVIDAAAIRTVMMAEEADAARAGDEKEGSRDGKSIVRLHATAILGREGHVHHTTLLETTGVPDSTIRRVMKSLMEHQGVRTDLVEGQRVYFRPEDGRGEASRAACTKLGQWGSRGARGRGSVLGEPEEPRQAAASSPAGRPPKSTVLTEKEHVALRLVERHGVVTRRSFVEALEKELPKGTKVSVSTASKVLRRMADRGLLASNGKEGRGGWVRVAGVGCNRAHRTER